MTRELDRRDLSANRVSSSRENLIRSLAVETSATLPGDHRLEVIGFETTTGNPSVVRSEAAPARLGNYVQRALQHVQSLAPVLGFEATQAADFIADPQPQTDSSGAVAVHLQQQLKGISIFQAAEAVRFSPSGAVLETAGSTLSVVGDPDPSATLSAGEAVVAAAQHLVNNPPDEHDQVDPYGEPMVEPQLDLSEFEASAITQFFDQPSQPAVFDKGPFEEPIRASLLWFPLTDQLRLCWEVVLTMPSFCGQYRILVDAQDSAVLYCRQLMHMAAARANVYTEDGSVSREMKPMPLPLNSYGLPIPNDLPAGFPDDWVATDRTVGNSTFARLGESGGNAAGTQNGGVVEFDPQDATGDAQKVLNIFYYNCVMHDYFYLLGFRERDGNFQLSSLGRGGRARDRVEARAHSGPVFGTANMATPADGSRPLMNMGLVTSTNRHTAFDATVVYHEFMHGVTNRLVGGAANFRALEAPQSGGMGEGWGDYIACTLTGSETVGHWVVNRANGIRMNRYDQNFPDHFGMLGQAPYDAVHNIGEIWCATLLQMNRNIGTAMGPQLVVDALKLSPANPSFLDMRDAILLAADNKRRAGQLDMNGYADVHDGIWSAFARFGMGPNASSNGASLQDVVADFNTADPAPRPAPTPDPVPDPVPDPEPNPQPTPSSAQRFSANPNLPIPDNSTLGVRSLIQVPSVGALESIKVEVDIPHTFIGDLRVDLISPSGTVVSLHRQTGGGDNNLQKSWASESHAGLGGLVGENGQGDWLLRVSDHARIDEGRLQSWAITIQQTQPAQPQSQTKEARPDAQIPDDDPMGISSQLAMTLPGAIRQTTLSVDIRHTFIGDLKIELHSPNGQNVILHNLSGGNADNVIRSWSSDNGGPLAALIGETAAGDWRLHVSDHAGADVGRLKVWSLSLEA